MALRKDSIEGSFRNQVEKNNSYIIINLMNDSPIYRIDGINWSTHYKSVPFEDPVFICTPYCTKDSFELDLHELNGSELSCPKCTKKFTIPRTYKNERNFVEKTVKAEKVRKRKVLNLDEQLIPIAEIKIKDDSDFFVTGRFMELGARKQLVVYVGEKGKKQKAELIADLTNRKLSFDHNDMDPREIFAVIEMTFDDGSKSKITKD